MNLSVDRLKIKHSVVYLMVFALFVYIFRKIPLIQDAWAGQIYNSSTNFVNWIGRCFPLYFTLNGRIIATIFVGFFERNEWLLDLANAIFMTAIVYLLENLSTKKKNIFSISLSLLFVLLVSANIRTEVYFYATMIYIMPVVWFFSFIMYVPVYLKDRRISRFAVLCVLGILNAGWIEHCGFAYVFMVGISWLIYTVKNRKVNLRFTFFEFLNGITFLIMAFSPGLRLQRNLESSENSVITNIKLTLQAVIFEHKFFAFVLVIICAVYVGKTWKNKVAIIIYQTIAFAYALLFLNDIFSTYLGIKCFSHIGELDCLQKGYRGIICIGIASVTIVLLLIALCTAKQRKKMLFIFGTAIFSFLPTIFTPNFSYRTCFFGGILLMSLAEMLFYEINIEQKHVRDISNIILILALAVQIDLYMILTANISQIQEEREARIEQVKDKQRIGDWDYNKTLILPSFSPDLLYAGASPEPYYDIIHYNIFLNFYGLNPDTLVIFSNELNELRIEEDAHEIKMEVLQNEQIEQEKYTYVFYIMQGGQPIWASEETESRIITIETPNVEGQCYFRCDIIDQDGGVQEVYSAKLFQ